MQAAWTRANPFALVRHVRPSVHSRTAMSYLVVHGEDGECLRICVYRQLRLQELKRGEERARGGNVEV